MKYFSILTVLLFISCLSAKKSPFDISSPGIGMGMGFALVFGSNSNSQTNTTGNTTTTTTTTNTVDTTSPTGTVTNLKSKGTIDTGLLIGTASDNVGVASVEVQINSGSYTTATTLTNSTTTTGTKDWTYKIPVTAKWTYAFTNTVNVRVTDTSGNTTISALTSVQKGENRDINGDGFIDLVVGAPTFGGNNGRVYVFNGSATGISQTSVTNASQTFTGTALRKFGSSIAMTDINGDGYADMVVCEFLAAGTNSSFYYLGSSSGFGSKNTIIQVNSTEYCRALVVGDFNNDGYGDVAISNSSSSDNGGNGNVYIYRGNSSGLNISPVQILTSPGTNLGMDLTSGDINGDGKTDLVARTSSNPYIVSFLSDGSNLVISSTFTTILNSQPVLADFNGDGKADLAAAEMGFSGNTGRVHIFLSNGTNLNTTSSQAIVGELAGNLFSNKIYAGDANQDGIIDLIIAHSGFDTLEYGKVYVFYGCLTTGICKGSVNASAADLKITGSPIDALQFGSSTRLIDINRDGFSDLLVGGPGYNNNGALFIFKGSASGISTSYTSYTNASSTIVETSASSNFGLSLY
ncbi:MAG TPA: VCBS repeat-containing protein [Leptospiraceae bacterium]|nr:VCBS repeat-containing protein [Leptospiraceae bacterium]